MPELRQDWRTPNMSVTVRIPTPLRRLTGGQDKVEAEGQNLGEVIASLESEYPGIKARLCDDSGELRTFVNVYVDGEDVRFLDGMTTATASGNEISIVPAVAGG
jgi:molybdopterin synthase sulfur carrier subunit